MAKFSSEEMNVSFQFPRGLRVLAIDADPTILEIVKRMCFQCHYRVVTCYDASLALNYVRKKKDCIDVILIEAHLPNMDGYEFVLHVTKETNVPVIVMSLDGSTSAVMKAITHGASDYWIKPLDEKQFRTIWKHLAMKRWNEKKIQKKDDSEFGSSILEDENVRDQKDSSSNSKESDNCYALPAAKKTRLTWKGGLHQHFVKAVMQVGLDKAQPKRILEVMNIPDLTKEHVASHLQKYRQNLNKSTGMMVAVQQQQINEVQLTNNIEAGRFDLIASGPTTSHDHPDEEPTSNNFMMPSEDGQWLNYFYAEKQGLPYSGDNDPMTKDQLSNSFNPF